MVAAPFSAGVYRHRCDFGEGENEYEATTSTYSFSPSGKFEKYRIITSTVDETRQERFLGTWTFDEGARTVTAMMLKGDPIVFNVNDAGKIDGHEFDIEATSKLVG